MQVRIGARGSPLSLAQTRQLRALLAAALGVTDADVDAALPITAITTTGDRLQEGRLIAVGGKGLFTKELDAALLERRIDIAVHSMKDLPAKLPDGIAVAATPARADPRDAFVSAIAERLEDLPEDAVVGTASLRRQAQTLFARPDLRIVTLRGNVDTRLEKIARGDAHATYLAMAGLLRLGAADRARSAIDPETAPPAPCQGVLAVTARADDAATIEAVARIHDPAVGVAVTAERAFMAALDGSCRTPIAALATSPEPGRLRLLCEALRPDGGARWRIDETVPLSAEAENDAAALGARLGRAIRDEAGDQIFEGP